MDYIKINDLDNVCVALNALPKGEKITIGSDSIETNSEIPAGHKVALKDIKAGEDVIKYGNRIGIAKEDIRNLFQVVGHVVQEQNSAPIIFRLPNGEVEWIDQ